MQPWFVTDDAYISFRYARNLALAEVRNPVAERSARSMNPRTDFPGKGLRFRPAVAPVRLVTHDSDQRAADRRCSTRRALLRNGLAVPTLRLFATSATTECQMTPQSQQCHATGQPCAPCVVSQRAGLRRSETPNRQLGCALGAMLALGLIFSGAGCRQKTPTSNPSRTEDAPTLPPNNESSDEAAVAQAEAMEQFAGLGYIGYSDEVADESRRGVVHNDRERSSPGYNLYGNPILTSAVLIDNTGEVIQSWEHPQGGNWANCELLPNGDLLVPGNAARTDPESERHHYLLRLSWDGNVIWNVDVSAHHDVEVTPRNQILTLTEDSRKRPIHRRLEILDAMLMLLSHDGEVVEELSLYETLITAPDVLKLEVKGVKRLRREGKRIIDLLHANSIEWMRHKHLEPRDPLYSASNVLISMRHQNAVAIIDWDSKRLVWAWGPGEILGPHDARMLENGNILLFDNGLKRKWSRVIEVNPLTRKIVWEYKAPTPTDFYTATRGGCQRLPNGNTLITDSNSGRVFEVTPDGEIVWEFLSPHLNEENHRATIVRMKRYEPAFIDRILQAHRPVEAAPSP